MPSLGFPPLWKGPSGSQAISHPLNARDNPVTHCPGDFTRISLVAQPCPPGQEGLMECSGVLSLSCPCLVPLPLLALLQLPPGSVDAPFPSSGYRVGAHKGEGIKNKGSVPPFPSRSTGTGTTPGSHRSWILPCLDTHFPNKKSFIPPFP